MLYLKSHLFDNLIEDIEKGFFNNLSCSQSAKADVIEGKNNYELNLEVPGIKEDELKIEVKDNNLIIKSERVKNNQKNEEQKYIFRERSNVNLNRVFHLPEDANKDKISAHLEDGILKLVIEKKAEEKAKLIKIN